jgi:hypothetical protein
LPIGIGRAEESELHMPLAEPKRPMMLLQVMARSLTVAPSEHSRSVYVVYWFVTAGVWDECMFVYNCSNHRDYLHWLHLYMKEPVGSLLVAFSYSIRHTLVGKPSCAPTTPWQFLLWYRLAHA